MRPSPLFSNLAQFLTPAKQTHVFVSIYLFWTFVAKATLDEVPRPSGFLLTGLELWKLECDRFHHKFSSQEEIGKIKMMSEIISENH